MDLFKVIAIIDVTIKDGGVANIELVNDGITIAGVDTSLGDTITQTTILAGSTVISSSILSSGTQGTAVLTSNGVNGSTIDLGLETTDNVIFNDISASGHITALGNITASGQISSSATVRGQNIIAANQLQGNDLDIVTNAQIGGYLNTSGSVIFRNLSTIEPTVTGSLWISGSSAVHPNSGYLMIFNP